MFQPITNEEEKFKLVEVIKNIPHCINHGAMNKVSIFTDGGGYWRCISAISDQNDNICRAGCQEIISYEQEKKQEENTIS